MGTPAEGNQLYVNRGIGFSLAPVRINCPPELTIDTLWSGGVGDKPAVHYGDVAKPATGKRS
jgi:hypothetical protein